MEQKLTAYIEKLFFDAPMTKRALELKEEILQNSLDKFHDLLAEGKGEDSAYNIAIASIGDISGLIDDLKRAAAPQSSGNYTSPEYCDNRTKRSAMITSIAVLMYICAVIPVIAFEDSVFSVILMFIIVGVATAMLIYNNMTRPKYQRTDDTMVEDFKVWREKSSSSFRTYKAIKDALWALTTAIYILVSFTTMAWHITWIIFPIAAAIEGIIRAFFDISR